MNTQIYEYSPIKPLYRSQKKEQNFAKKYN